MNITGVLFDLDGVLVDTEGIYSEFWHAMDVIYPTGVDAFEQVIKGSTLDRILSCYFPDSEVQADILRRLEDHERNMTYRLFDGVVAFLNDLDEHNIPAAIVTSSNSVKMLNLFSQIPGLRDRFAAVVTDADVRHSKPAPDGYLVGAERLGCLPEDCYVFEDSYNGVEAGRRSGAVVIALSTTNPRERLEAMADSVIDGFVGYGVTDMLSTRRRAVSKP